MNNLHIYKDDGGIVRPCALFLPAWILPWQIETKRPSYEAFKQDAFAAGMSDLYLEKLKAEDICASIDDIDG